MLDIDTLDTLHDLTARTLYRAEVAHLPQFSREEVEIFIDHARVGNTEARNAFLLSCLEHTFNVACHLYNHWVLHHDDLLDLVQHANERMIEKLDCALATSAPAAYLRGIGRRAMLDYCIYHSGLINKPEYAFTVLQKMDARATTFSLEMQVMDGMQIAQELMPSEPEEDTVSYEELYDAISQLPEYLQETIIRLYGLFGQPEEKAGDIGPGNLIRNRAYEARLKLRKVLLRNGTLLRSKNAKESTTVRRTAR